MQLFNHLIFASLFFNFNFSMYFRFCSKDDRLNNGNGIGNGNSNNNGNNIGGGRERDWQLQQQQGQGQGQGQGQVFETLFIYIIIN